jgi:hypothetical protein
VWCWADGVSAFSAPGHAPPPPPIPCTVGAVSPPPAALGFKLASYIQFVRCRIDFTPQT